MLSGSDGRFLNCKESERRIDSLERKFKKGTKSVSEKLAFTYEEYLDLERRIKRLERNGRRDRNHRGSRNRGRFDDDSDSDYPDDDDDEDEYEDSDSEYADEKYDRRRHRRPRNANRRNRQNRRGWS